MTHFANITEGLRFRIVLEPGVALGPGKANLLQAIDETGSLTAAAARFGMSYKRGWTLVREMNAAFAEPLKRTVPPHRSDRASQTFERSRSPLHRALLVFRSAVTDERHDGRIAQSDANAGRNQREKKHRHRAGCQHGRRSAGYGGRHRPEPVARQGSPSGAGRYADADGPHRYR